MKRVLITASAAMLMLQYTAPVSASVSAEEAVCPIEQLGDEKAEEFGQLLANGSELSDKQSEQVGNAVNACMQKSNWSEADSKLAVDFTVSMITILKLEDMLTDAGVDTADIKSVLENQSPDVLSATVENADDSPLIGAAIDKLVAQLGDENVTDQIAGYVGSYVVMGARAQLIVAALVDDPEQP